MKKIMILLCLVSMCGMAYAEDIIVEHKYGDVYTVRELVKAMDADGKEVMVQSPEITVNKTQLEKVIDNANTSVSKMMIVLDRITTMEKSIEKKVAVETPKTSVNWSDTSAIE